MLRQMDIDVGEPKTVLRFAPGVDMEILELVVQLLEEDAGSVRGMQARIHESEIVVSYDASVLPKGLAAMAAHLGKALIMAGEAHAEMIESCVRVGDSRPEPSFMVVLGRMLSEIESGLSTELWQDRLAAEDVPAFERAYEILLSTGDPQRVTLNFGTELPGRVWDISQGLQRRIAGWETPFEVLLDKRVLCLQSDCHEAAQMAALAVIAALSDSEGQVLPLEHRQPIAWKVVDEAGQEEGQVRAMRHMLKALYQLDDETLRLIQCGGEQRDGSRRE
ncbi:MAG: hypothetical protein J0L97_02235 [Alphaproteobacteria bacterium]|nr:hypothetical protein [Alphaproteobacteria bacterium]